MWLVLYPYFSQQDKRLQLFLLRSDSGVKLYTYVANRAAELGWRVTLVLPSPVQCVDEPPLLHRSIEVVHPPYGIHISNFARRLQWDPMWLERLAKYGDALLTQHETLAVPLKLLHPRGRVCTEFGMLSGTAWPETWELQRMALQASDAVHCNSAVLREHAKLALNVKRALLWPFAYNDSLYEALPYRSWSERDVDVLFNSRASATGYSNHEAFMQAMLGSGLRVTMTDPTSYLRCVGGVPEDWVPSQPLASPAYEQLLNSSRVAVSLTVSNGYGGYAIREAFAAGACPVTPRAPAFTELLTEDWPYFATDCEPAEVRRAVLLALRSGGLRGVQSSVLQEAKERLQASSYSAAWRVARSDLEELCCG